MVNFSISIKKNIFPLSVVSFVNNCDIILYWVTECILLFIKLP